MAGGIGTHVNMKNKFQQIARVEFDEAKDSVWIGGGTSDARRLVGEEFADITGGSRIQAHELDDLPVAMLTSSGNEAPGLEGVKLVSLSSDTFTISFKGWFGTENIIEFSGDAAEEAIESVLFELGNGNSAVNFKNSASQVTLFDTVAVNSIFVGSSNAASDEASDIIGGSSLNTSEMEDLLIATVTGKASNGSAGVEGVTLVGLTDQGFSLQIDGQADTTDTIIFEGQAALEAIAAADAARGADFKDGDTALDVFDLSSETKEFVGGTNPGTIGQDFDDLIGGSSISADDVLDIFEALVSGKKYDAGLEEVELIGLNSTSFSIAVNTSGGNTDYILFTDVDELEGAAAFGFVDAGDAIA